MIQNLNHKNNKAFWFIINNRSKTGKETVLYINLNLYVFEVCNINTIKNVADITVLKQGKNQAMFNHYAKKILDAREAAIYVYFGIDDIAACKGHNYLTVVYNHATG